MNRLAIVVPCYNEMDSLFDTNTSLQEVLNDLKNKNKISKDSFILYVDDGSKDKTWSIIKEFCKNQNHVSGLKLAANRGHQYALYAGLIKAKDICDFTISIDADLQDDVNAIKEMVDKYLLGCDIVHGVRSDRSSDLFFKKFSAESFYKVSKLLGAKGVYNSADFRLMSKKALEILDQYKETNLYLRGIAQSIGLKQDVVTYKRKPRLKGESKYPLSKMLKLAFDGITSSSNSLLNLIFYFGLLIFTVSFLAFIYYLIFDRLNAVFLILVNIWMVCGIILGSIGITCVYMGRVFTEVKKRPRYSIDEFVEGKTYEN